MSDATPRAWRRASAYGLLLLALGASGCSLLLDASNCEDDSECAPGICKSGVCFGPRSASVDVGPDLGDEEDAGDATIDDDMGDMDARVTTDSAVETPDVLIPADVPRFLAPTCEILTPGPDDRLVDQALVEVGLVVIDRDSPREALTVTLNDEPVSLDANGMAMIQLELDEGSNPIVLRATDLDRQSCTERISVVVDTTAPVLELEQPGGASTLTNQANFQFVGRVVETNRVDELMVTRGGVEIPDLDVRWTADRFQFTVALERGENRVEVSTADAVGNEADPVAVTLQLDDEPPVVSIDAPRDGLRTGAARVEVAGSVQTDDPFFVSQVVVTATQPGGRPHDTRPIRAGGGSFRTQINLREGENVIEACGDDPAGNRACASITVFRENQEPCVEIETPPEGRFVSGARVEVTGTVCPVVTSVELTVPGADPVMGNVAAGRFSAFVVLPGAGRHTITATARSENGSEAEATRIINLDDTPPRVRISSPDAGRCYNDEALRVCGTATDGESGVTEVVGESGGVRVVGELANGQFCVSIPVPEGRDRDIVITATNGAGIAGSSTLRVNVDRVAPRVQMDIAQDAFVAVNGAGRVEIGGHILLDNEICPITTLVIDGRQQAILAGGLFTFRGVFEDGPRAITIVATDQANNRGERNFSFRVDSAAPTLDNIVPREPLVTSEQITTISAKTCDGGSGVDPARLTIGAPPGNAVEPRAANEPGCFNISRTVGVPEGVTEFVIAVHDRVGNRTTHTVVVSRDVSPPTVTVAFPRPDESIESTFNAEGTVSDGELGSGVNRVTVNGVEARIDGFLGTWRAENVPAGGGGAQTIEVVSFDNAGNRSDPLLIPVTVDEYVLTDRDRSGFGGASATGWIGAFDVNGDNLTDIVALTRAIDGDTGVFTQNADGTFTSRGVVETGLPEGEITDAAVGDFDNDGEADLFIVGNNVNGLWRGIAAAAFQRVAVGAAQGLASTGVAVGDVNRDGALDVLIFAADQTRMLFGNGMGGFDREPLLNLDISDATSYQGGKFVDVNGDGVLDLVAFGPGGSRIWIGDRSGIFVTPAPIPDLAATTATLIDANRDGILDVYTAAPGNGRFLLGNGASLPSSNALGLALAASESKAIAADLDGDTRDDLVVFGAAGFKLWRNTAGAGFERIDEVAAGIPALLQIRAATVADIDRDGDFDIIGADDDGPFLIRANGSARRDGYRFVHLDVRRAQPGASGPNDSLGVQVLQDIQGDETPERALAPTPFGPTLVTLGGAQQGNFTVRFVDKGAVGINVRSVGPLQPGSLTIVSGRE